MQYLVLLGAVDTDVLSGTEVAYLRIERRKLRHLDKGAEPLLLDNLIGDGELIVGRFLGKDRCPCIKAVDALPLQRLRTEVLKQKVQLGQ